MFLCTWVWTEVQCGSGTSLSSPLPLPLLPPPLPHRRRAARRPNLVLNHPLLTRWHVAIVCFPSHTTLNLVAFYDFAAKHMSDWQLGLCIWVSGRMQICFPTAQAPAKSDADGARQPLVYPERVRIILAQWGRTINLHAHSFFFFFWHQWLLLLVLCDTSAILSHGFLIRAHCLALKNRGKGL